MIERAEVPGRLVVGVGETPLCRFDLGRLSERIAALTEAGDRLGVRLAYSIKTNPSPEVLERVRADGLLAEAINLAEVDLAVETGWQLEDIVLNGPVKTWGASAESAARAGLHSSMCDCVEELQGWFADPSFSKRLGIRLKPVDTDSRFGVDLSAGDERAAVERAVQAAHAAGIPLALHFHVNSVLEGLAWWLATAEKTFLAAASIAELRASARCIDLGGGWDEVSLDALLVDQRLAPLLDELVLEFPNAREFILEPGEGLVTSCGEVVARVVRAPRKDRVVVDASTAELPYLKVRDRPVVHHPAAAEPRLISGRGHGVIFGRSCREKDLLAVDVDLSEVQAGDHISFGDAGAYDTSNRTRFGSGNREARAVFAR